MGAANCCKKPDEIVVEEVKYSSTENNKNMANDQDSIPQDTEQVHRSNVNYEDEANQNQAVSNQNLYEQDGGSPKIGGAYEVPINVSSPQQNYEEGIESNHLGSLQQNDNMQIIQGNNINQYQQDDQAVYQFAKNQEMEGNINSPMSGEGNAYAGNQEDEAIDYNELVNQVGNEANLKALRLANSGLNSATSAAYNIQQSQQAISNNYNIQKNNIENMGGINLNTLSSAQQQGGLDLKGLNLAAQKGPNTSSHITTTRKIEYNNLGATGQLNATTTTITRQFDSSQQNESEDLNKYFQQATSKFGSVNIAQRNEETEKYYPTEKESSPLVDLKQLSNSANAQAPGGLDLDKLIQQDDLPTQTKVTKVTTVKPISTNEDISKYFKQTNTTPVNQSSLPAKIKASSNLQFPAQENLNKYFQNTESADVKKEEKIITTQVKTSEEPNNDNLNQIKITKIDLDMDDLPETFGSSNIANFKQTTTTTTTKTTGNGDKPAQTTTTTTSKTIGNIDMKDLPEVFGSFDINKYKQPVPNTKKEEINAEKPDNNNFKQETTTTTTKTFGDIALDMKDLPEVFGSSDINNFKQTTTTTTTKTTENIDLKDFNIDLKNYQLDMKDLPEVFGSSDINRFKQTTTSTTTTNKEGGDLGKKEDTKQITTTEGIINMKDLPEVFGSSDINHFKQTTTTTTTTTKKEGGDLQKKESNKDIKQITTTTNTTAEGIIDMKDLPEVFGSSDINNYKQTKTTTTITTTKKVGEDLNKLDNKDVKQIITTTKTEGIIDMKDLPEVFGSFNISHFKQAAIEGNSDAKDLTKGIDTSNLKNVKQTTTTTTKEGGNFDLKDLPPGFDFSNLDNVKQTTTTTKTVGALDMKDLPEVFGSSDINNFKQTTTTTSTTGTLDMKDLPETFGSSDINNFKQTTTTTTITNILDMKDLPETFGSSNINNYKQTQTKTTTTKTTGNSPIDLNKFSLEKNASAEESIFSPPDAKNTTKTTVTKKTVQNGPIDLKQFGIEQNPSANPTTENEDFNKYFKTKTQTTSEAIDLKQFGIEQNPSAMSNFQKVKTTKTETINTGNIDLKQFGIEQNPSASPINRAGAEDYSKYFQTTSQTTSGPIGLKHFGMGQNATTGLTTGTEDYSKYFQTTKTSTTKASGPAGVSLGANGGQQNATTTTITKTTKVGVPTSSASGFTSSYSFPNATTNNAISYGTTQNTTSHYSSYGGNKVTNTKVVRSYVSPTTTVQTYRYNYSYNTPATTKTTVTKTTYSRVA